MTEEQFSEILSAGESSTVEFKSWIHAKNMRERVDLAVEELVAFANTQGGTVYFGVEDDEDHTVTGCGDGHDCQAMIESIYDKTRPPLFAGIEEFTYKGKKIISLSVERDGTTYATTGGKCLKRLGKNSKPYYPAEMSHKYTQDQNPDFSAQIVSDSTTDDISKLEVYSLKEKLKSRDPAGTLADQDDMNFLRDMSLVRIDGDTEKLTVAGLLFVGKESAIRRLMPQAEVIYLHYSSDDPDEYDSRLDMVQPLITVIDRLTERILNSSRLVNIQVGLFRLEVEEFPEKVFQEALLNALSHRDYQSSGAVYVKHYPDKIVIENPGGFLEGITEKNIISHPSVPRNKLIAETLQRLKYVQRTGQGVDIIFKEMVSMGKPYPTYHTYGDSVSLAIYNSIDDKAFIKFVVREQEEQQKIFSLSELMILRHLTDNRKGSLSELQDLTQRTAEDVRKSCNNLIKMSLVEIVGKDYMLTAKAYDAVKSDVDYARDKTVRYIKAKNMIMEYLKDHKSISRSTVEELCGFTKKQARIVLDKMRDEDMIITSGKGRGTEYIKK